jgi:hypothetical protein
VEKKKIIKTSSIIIILFSFFLLLIVVTYFFTNENLVFSQQNLQEDPVIGVKYQQENFSDFDIFGIKKIYPTKKGSFEWFMNNHDPESDRMSVYSKNGIGYPEGNMETYSFTELSKKGYWYKPTDWKNVEVTGEYLYKKGEGPGITHYARSEDHSTINNGCGGSSYKLKIHFDGTSSISKEQSHPKPWTISINKNPLIGNKLDKDWFRFKGIMYNLPDGSVKLESWLDPFLNNTWIKIAEYQDKGGWGKDGEKCQGKEDQIITWGSPIVTFRWDDALVYFRSLSIREIQPPVISDFIS